MTEHKTRGLSEFTRYLMLPIVVLLFMGFAVPVHADEFRADEFPITNETIMLHPDILQHTNVPAVLLIDEVTISNPDVIEHEYVTLAVETEQIEEPTLVNQIVDFFRDLLGIPIKELKK